MKHFVLVVVLLSTNFANAYELSLASIDPSGGWKQISLKDKDNGKEFFKSVEGKEGFNECFSVVMESFGILESMGAKANDVSVQIVFDQKKHPSKRCGAVISATGSGFKQTRAIGLARNDDSEHLIRQEIEQVLGDLRSVVRSQSQENTIPYSTNSRFDLRGTPSSQK